MHDVIRRSAAADRSTAASSPVASPHRLPERRFLPDAGRAQLDHFALDAARRTRDGGNVEQHPQAITLERGRQQTLVRCTAEDAVDCHRACTANTVSTPA